MKKILLSGFSAFGANAENSSEVLVHMLQDRGITGFELRSVILPVSYSSSFSALEKELDVFSPDLVIAFGLAEKRSKISIEKVAINLKDSEFPDNDGVIFQNAIVSPSGENAHFSTLETEKMRVLNTEFPIEQSLSAGAFLCNYVMYRLLERLKYTSVKAGFIHLPHLNNHSEEIYRTVVELICLHS